MSEDRKQFGLLVGMDVKTNIAMASMEYYVNPFGWMQCISRWNNNLKNSFQRLRIKTPSGNQLVKNLSGGNQQKVVIGKWLTRDSDILIFDEPTRGIDIGGKR
ncbi:ATP-binding cassette domain-containing protein [Bacillus pacificus]